MGDLADRRPRLRLMSFAVLLLVSGLAVAGCLVTRRVVADQEHRLLQQRAEEAALYLSSAVSSVQTELASLAASAAATGERPAAFEKSSTLLTAVPGGFTSVALVRAGPPPTVIASSGGSLAAGGLGPIRSTAVSEAIEKVGLTGALVATPLFRSGGKSLLGFAYSSPTLPDAVVYAESQVQPTSTQTTSSQPFSELTAAVYAGPKVRADQLVAASGGVHTSQLPLTGHTATVQAAVGKGRPWLLVAKARRTLVGSVATWTPWVLLAVGLLAALLATGIVETLARRREYAQGLVDIRTEELQRSLAELADAHDQLVRQERLAAIGQLASTVGHEMRNPLGVISNAIYLLRGDLGDSPTPAAKRHLATAEREVSAATVIVSDLLEFAREREPVLDDVDLVALLDEVLAILPPPAGVDVRRSSPTQVMARADRDMVRQVLLNLVGNAYQAMPDGGSLTVEISDQGGMTRIRVADTGHGMTDDVRQRVFEPFFTTKARGVGLGLSVTRRIVEAHRGDISVTSDPEHGTAFVVVLPQLAPPRQPAESENATTGSLS